MSVVPGTPLTGTAAMADYDRRFQIAPIILEGGQLSTPTPISTYMGPFLDATGTFTGRFQVIPSGTLISQAIGMYPFANQSVAANATIQQPLNVSLVMSAPVNQTGGYLSKQAAFSSLQATLQNHNNAGGWYTVATPAFVYQNVLLLTMTDITSQESKQQQIEWQFDFIAPIITSAQAQAAENALMSKFTNGNQLPNPPTWSGL